MRRLAAELAKHRQQHEPDTGASSCVCGAWRGPYTMYVTDGRSYGDHLADVVTAWMQTLIDDLGRRGVHCLELSANPNEDSNRLYGKAGGFDISVMLLKHALKEEL